MTSRNCPDPEELRQYAVGMVPEERAAVLEEHCRTCTDCEATIVSLENSSDVFVEALRRPARTQYKQFFADPAFLMAVRKAYTLAPKADVTVVQAPPSSVPPRDVAELLLCLSQSGLMSGEEVETLRRRLPSLAVGDNPQSLLERLVREERLTEFQAQAVAGGDAAILVMGNYVLFNSIGKGGMGCVYQAWHKKMKRMVALKLLPVEETNSIESVRRFQREVEAAAKLSHPNIVTAYDADEAHGVHFLVMEFVDGKDLGSLVQEVGPLAVGEAVDCILQAARGLEYAHGQGLVHRDIKPANFLRDKNGTVRILDMGLARLENGPWAHDDGLTRSGQVVGTAGYMSPEQALDAHQVDARSDIYSLGCSLHYLLTGRSPYGGDTVTQKILLHREHPIPLLSATRPDVPESLQAAFQKMLAKKPDQRQASMAEVIADLEACLPVAGGLPVAETVGRAAESAAEKGGSLTPTSPWSEALLPAPLSRSSLPVRLPAVLRLTTRPRRIAAATAFGFTAVVLLSAVMFRLQTAKGTLVVEVLDADTIVQVLGEAGKVQVERRADAGTLSISVDPGKHRLRLEKDGLELFARDFVLGAGGRETVRATFETGKPRVAVTRSGSQPPRAAAPFDAAKAAEHQQGWASHLGVPRETANAIGMKLVLIPPGEFEMGATDEEIAWAAKHRKNNTEPRWYHDRLPSMGPRHRVSISKPFYLARYEVTQGEYQRVMGRNPSTFSPAAGEMRASSAALSPGEKAAREARSKRAAGADTNRHPVESVSWFDAAEFCRRLSAFPKERAEQRVYRLPTEAEWEYACRAGTTSRWSCEDNEASLPEYACFNANSAGSTSPVGQKKPNAWGLHDMHGNVWEWCADWLGADYYRHSPSLDPAGPSTGTTRLLRGGAWNFSSAHGWSAFRFTNVPTRNADCYGFRVACDR